MIIGGMIGAMIGFLFAGPLGLVIGFAVGHFFGRGYSRMQKVPNPEEKAAIEKAFFDAIFPLLGRLAKSDGHISEEEVSGTEQLMMRMGLSPAERQMAITLFKQGAEPDYDANATVDEFVRVCGNYNNLRQIFLVYLITIAYADGTLHEAEEKLMLEVAAKLGYSRFAFNHLVGMIQAQTHFYRGQQGGAGYRNSGFQQPPAREDELALAYKALGVSSDISDAELKKAYRKLMSEFHPDKLAGRGVPEDMVKLATERSQEIQVAYDLVKKSRKKQ